MVWIYATGSAALVTPLIFSTGTDPTGFRPLVHSLTHHDLSAHRQHPPRAHNERQSATANSLSIQTRHCIKTLLHSVIGVARVHKYDE
jgi:hypothetical protein